MRKLSISPVLLALDMTRVKLFSLPVRTGAREKGVRGGNGV